MLRIDARKFAVRLALAPIGQLDRHLLSCHSGRPGMNVSALVQLCQKVVPKVNPLVKSQKVLAPLGNAHSLNRP